MTVSSPASGHVPVLLGPALDALAVTSGKNLCRRDVRRRRLLPRDTGYAGRARLRHRPGPACRRAGTEAGRCRRRSAVPDRRTLRRPGAVARRAGDHARGRRDRVRSRRVVGTARCAAARLRLSSRRPARHADGERRADGRRRREFAQAVGTCRDFPALRRGTPRPPRGGRHRCRKGRAPDHPHRTIGRHRAARRAAGQRRARSGRRGVFRRCGYT